MTGKKEFYIGWEPKAPQSYARWSRMVILILSILIIVGAGMYVMNQKGFENGVYEYNKFTEVTGIIYKEPVPMIKVKVENDEYRNFLFFGFGKSDALETIHALEQQVENLEEHYVTLQSELIYYDGRTLLEVPADKNKMHITMKIEGSIPERQIEELGSIELTGQIVDSKCYFGVMKPGYGKIHRSCGIRCISGGIPPIMVINNDSGQAQYFIIVGPDGEVINQEILQYVGVPVKIKGNLQRVDDWFVLKMNPTDVRQIAIDKNFKPIYLTDQE